MSIFQALGIITAEKISDEDQKEAFRLASLMLGVGEGQQALKFMLGCAMASVMSAREATQDGACVEATNKLIQLQMAVLLELACEVIQVTDSEDGPIPEGAIRASDVLKGARQ